MRTAPDTLALALALLFAAASVSTAARQEDRFQDPRLRRLWQGWVDDTIEESHRTGGVAVIVDKLGRRGLLISGGKVVEQYTVELGHNGLADKLYEGDGATPEGRYRVTSKRGRGQTRFHRALMLDYPTGEDRREHAEARQRGLVPRGRGPGGLIEIHGHGGRGIDWTDGCVALRNADMDRLFAAVEVGTPVTIAGSARLPGDPP